MGIPKYRGTKFPMGGGAWVGYIWPIVYNYIKIEREMYLLPLARKNLYTVLSNKVHDRLECLSKFSCRYHDTPFAILVWC